MGGDRDMGKAKRAVKQAYKNMRGKELARLVLEHYVEKDHNRPGLLSDADIQAIHNALAGRRLDILEFNAWIETYRLVYMTQLDGKILTLEAENEIKTITPLLEKYVFQDLLQGLKLYGVALVTQKQYEELKERQRQAILAEVKSLAEIIGERVYWVAREILSKEEQEVLDEDLLGLVEDPLWAREHLPQVWGAALTSLAERLKAKRGPLEQQALEALERLKAGPLDATEAEAALAEPISFSVSALCELGLPEWLEWANEYKPGYDSGDPVGRLVAIVQNPPDDLLDERGYYTEPYPLEDAIRLISPEALDKRYRDRGGSLMEVCQTVVAAVADKIADLLSMQAVLETLSEQIGVDLTEDFDQHIAGLRQAVDSYNFYIEKLEASPQARAGKPYAFSRLPEEHDLPTLDFESLGPSQEWLSYYAERMAINLGPDWYKNVKEESDLFRLALDTMAEASKATGRPLSGLEQQWEETPDER